MDVFAHKVDLQSLILDKTVKGQYKERRAKSTCSVTLKLRKWEKGSGRRKSQRGDRRSRRMKFNRSQGGENFKEGMINRKRGLREFEETGKKKEY